MTFGAISSLLGVEVKESMITAVHLVQLFLAAAAPSPVAAVTEEPLLGAGDYRKRLQRCVSGAAELAIPNCTAVIQTLDVPDEVLVAAFAKRGDARYARGEFVEALADYEAALGMAPAAVEVQMNRAAALGNLGRYRQAIEGYSKVIVLRPTDARAFNGRGAAYVRVNEADLAIADYDRAISLDPRYAEAFNNRGVVRSALGQLDAALADFDAALKLDPRYADAFNNRAVALIRRGDNTAAVADLTRALELRPGFADAHYNRAVALERLGRAADAQKDYEAEKAARGKARP